MIPSHEVEGQLQRILHHPLFEKSNRLAGFLRFTVRQTLAGSPQELKEYPIGVHVFDRGEAFRPLEDPIVRIMAGRLRAKLAEYYTSGGQRDPITIELPRGGYVPRFSWRNEIADLSRMARDRAVGREREVTQLHDAWAQAASGAGLMVSLSGDPGMGKTTLAEMFLESMGTRGLAEVAHGRCPERLSDSGPFAALLEALGGLSRVSGMDGILRATAPAWWQQLVAGQEPGGAKPPSAERLRREFVAFFVEISQRRPVLMLLDDLHWANASTCELLAYLGARIRSLRLLIVGTFRPGEVTAPDHPFTGLKLDLMRRGMYRELPVSLLGREDVERYVGLRFPGHRFPARFAAVVHERTEGNPLFMADLLRFLSDQEVVSLQEHTWVLNKDMAEVSRVIPVGTQGMIDARIVRLEEDDREILRHGAIQGVYFDSAAIARALPADPAIVEERLRALENVHRLVRAVHEQDTVGQPPSVRYRFAHVLYQNSIWASVTPSRRAAMSLAVANAIEHLSADAPGAPGADLALLFEYGRDYRSSARFFLQAARNAARVFAYPESIQLCERGLRSLAMLPECRERDEQELLYSLILGMALMSTRGYAAPEVEKTYRRSKELCAGLGELRRLGPVLWAIHTCEANSGRLADALRTAREMREAAERLKQAGAVIESLHAEGTTLAFMGRLTEARELLERVFVHATPAGHELRASLYVLDPLVTSLSMLARLLAMLGHLDTAMERAGESVALASRLVHPPSVAYATFWAGWIHHARGEHSAACGQFDAAAELCKAHGLALVAEWVRVVRGATLARMGRGEEGLKEIRKSIDRQDAMRSRLERPYCLTLLAEAELAAGNYSEALRHCGEALELGRRTEGRCYEPETLRVQGEALLATGADSSREEALAALREGVAMARRSECRLLELRAAISCFRAAAPGARAMLAEVLARLTEGKDAPAVTEGRRLLED